MAKKIVITDIFTSDATNEDLIVIEFSPEIGDPIQPSDTVRIQISVEEAQTLADFLYDAIAELGFSHGKAI